MKKKTNKPVETIMYETFHGFTVVTEPSRKFKLMDLLEKKGIQIRGNSISDDDKEAYIYISASKSRKESIQKIFNDLKANDFCYDEANELPY